MKRGVLLVLLAAACGGSQMDNSAERGAASNELDTRSGGGAHEPPMLGVHWARGQGPAKRSSSADLLFRGGTILQSTITAAIFWGASWSDSSFVGDKVTGLDSWYSGFGGSNYAATNSEYSGTNGQVGTSSAYAGHVVDTSAVPNNAGQNTTPILNEACKVFPNPDPNALYTVYVDAPRGNRGFCAWHSWGTCNGKPIQFAFFFNLDGDPGCDPEDTSGLHSQGLAALANVTGHELSETMTDPRGAGWVDAAGAENADKCAWTFGAPLLRFSNNTRWKIQGNWSNTAFDSGTGYPNRGGQLGCLGTK
jgi:hypothetical protein